MKKISDLPIGAKVKEVNTKYDGKAIIWIIADKNHEGYPRNTVTLISEKALIEKAHEYDYEKSEIRTWINDNNGLLKNFSSKFKNAIVSTTLTIDSTTNVTDKLFLPASEEVGISRMYGDDGKKFPLFSDDDSRICKDLNGDNVTWWTRTKELYSYDYYCISTYGGKTEKGENISYGVRPVCNLKSGTFVYDNKNSDGVYTITWNKQPIIESTTSTNLGQKSKEFSFTYTVKDEDAGQTITVEEYLDNTRTKQFSATSGSTYTFNLSRLDYQKVLNGNHRIKIVVKDSDKGVAEKVFNFSKNETKILFTMEKPFVADSMVSMAMINVIGSIPEKAILTVETCNNGNDANPTWEDVTDKVLKERKIFFSNKQKTASNWGFNVRVSLDRNGASGDCYISSIGGNFE